MGYQNIIAQLREDISTAEQAGDHATAQRLEDELSAAIDVADRSSEDDRTDVAAETDLVGSGTAPQRDDLDAESRSPEATEPPD
ncbi:hypothetical protein [Nocardia sp. NPDC048505]|uniref:hypothetical protein n=1 Tax=unclassified Nocardia TaxID=2637762 RepID=UPI003401AA80